MPLVLDATPAGASSNTYIVLADAELYYETRLHVDDWENASDVEKNAALVWATRLLDEWMDWDGSNYVDTQALRWPRSGIYDPDGVEVDDTTIPSFLENATAEFARYLIAADRTGDFDTSGFKMLKVGSLVMQMDKVDRIPTLPDSVYQMVKFYGTKIGGASVSLLRT